VFYQYDNGNRLTNVVQGSFTSSLGYDDLGRRTSLTLPNAMQVLYRYDTASRLTNITYLGAVTNRIDYTYDPTGNRSSQASGFSVYNLPTAVPNSLYDVANHQLTFGDYNMLYDLDGNVTNIINGTTTNQLLWSARNQLTNMLGAVTATFAYDGLGRRVGRTVPASTENYLYDGLDTILQKDAGGSVAARYFRGLSIDEPWQRIDSTSTRDYMADALGSTVAMTDTNGVIQGQYAYEPFGATTMTGALTNSYKFTGREDDGTGLYYYRARYYHPALGRFVSEDPIGFDGGDFNVYAYVRSSPINRTDSYGLMLVDSGVEICGVFDLTGGHSWLRIPSAGWSAGFWAQQNVSTGSSENSCSSCKSGNSSRSSRGGGDGIWGQQGIIYSPDPYEFMPGHKSCLSLILDDAVYDIDKFKGCIKQRASGSAPNYWVIGNNCHNWADNTVADCKQQSKK
jgi:RHS repeat-associated protein